MQSNGAAHPPRKGPRASHSVCNIKPPPQLPQSAPPLSLLPARGGSPTCPTYGTPTPASLPSLEPSVPARCTPRYLCHSFFYTWALLPPPAYPSRAPHSRYGRPLHHVVPRTRQCSRGGPALCLPPPPHVH